MLIWSLPGWDSSARIYAGVCGDGLIMTSRFDALLSQVQTWDCILVNQIVLAACVATGKGRFIYLYICVYIFCGLRIPKIVWCGTTCSGRWSQENENFSGTKAEKQIGDTQLLENTGEVRFAQHRNLFLFFQKQVCTDWHPSFVYCSLLPKRKHIKDKPATQTELAIDESAHKITFLFSPQAAVQMDAGLFTGYRPCCPTDALITTESPAATEGVPGVWEQAFLLVVSS